MERDVTLPRLNGELVFSAPWEGRAFGMTLALKDGGQCRWEEFRDRLIVEVAQRDGDRPGFTLRSGAAKMVRTEFTEDLGRQR